MEKLFTLREVDALIPELETVLQHMETIHDRMHELAGDGAHERVHHKAAATPAEVADAARLESQMEFLLQVVQADIDHIEDLGGIVKDLDAGLVDFPGLVEGQEAWLCWQKGEKKIHFWHPLHSGFSERRALKRSSDRPGTTH